MSKVEFNGIATVGVVVCDRLKPTFRATDGSFSFAVVFIKYKPEGEIVLDEKCSFNVPVGVPAPTSAQFENVRANVFWFLVITVLADVPASAGTIGSNAIAMSALLPPLIVQVVSLIAPEKEIMPPGLFVAASTEPDIIDKENIDRESICLGIINPIEVMY